MPSSPRASFRWVCPWESGGALQTGVLGPADSIVGVGLTFCFPDGQTMAQNSLSFFHGQSGWLLDPSLPGQGAGFLMVLLVTTSQFLETKLWL